MHLCPPPRPRFRHQRGVNSPRWCALNTHERGRVLAGWYGSRRHDGETAFRSCRRLLRDLQILRKHPIGQLHEERAWYALS